MTNKIGIEIEGGEDIKISKAKINMDGDAKGIVSRNSKRNTFEDIEINIHTNETLINLKKILENINDNTINTNTNNTFKQDSLDLIKSIDVQKKELDAITKIGALTTILSNWVTIQTALSPILSPYIDLLIKPFGG
ncbi:hypothetical protein V5F22_12775 [Acinetobacter baumannii]